MEYRALGKTGLKVSAIGLGSAQLGSPNTEYAVRMVHRALELGVTFFDTARSYWDSEVKLGLALQGQREKVVISTKTGKKTREDAWREINESLERLRTDYLDNIHLHGLELGEDLNQRLGPGGALEALLQAKEQGMARHVGCTSHRSVVLLEALKRFDFEVILVPMNIVERDPLLELIPLCQQKDVGVTIMKPLATGLLPAPLALKWLLNQPIAAAVPGMTSLEELESIAAVFREGYELTAAEQAAVDSQKETLEHVRCRICGLCEPCPQGIDIGSILGTDVTYDHYRSMGADTFRSFPWSRVRIEEEVADRQKTIAAIESCTRCGQCEPKCPHGLPIVDMLQSMLPAMREMLAMHQEALRSGTLAP